MNNQAYYRTEPETGCDVADAGSFLLVNCSGVCVLSVPFQTHNRTGRRDFYLMYLYEGELEMEIGGRLQAVGAGSAVVFPPGCPYRYVKRKHDELIYYWAHFTGAGAGELLERCTLRTQYPHRAGVSAEIADAFHAMFRNFIARDGCFEVAAAAQLASICVALSRRAAGAALSEARNAQRVRKSLDYMHRHYRDPVTVAELAGIEHLSSSRYSAVFRQCMGVSPRDFLIGLRLGMSVELMRGTDLSLKQIAGNVGYDDQLYFSRLFRSKMGVSPSAYMSAGKKEGSREQRSAGA